MTEIYLTISLSTHNGDDTPKIQSILQLLWPRLLLTNTSDYARLQANAAPYRRS